MTEETQKPEETDKNLSGGDVNAGGGDNPAVGNVPGGEAPAVPPVSDANNPTLPAAAAVIAPTSSPHQAENEQSSVVSDFEADEVKRDAKDKPPLKRRSPDAINNVIGSHIVAYNGGRATWKLKSGIEFSVTRYYPTKGVAIDFPVDDAEQATCAEKRAKLHELGVVYVCIELGMSMTTADIVLAVEREQKLLSARKGA